MVVMTYTRRQVLDMLPEFLTERLATFDAVADAFAKEVGISRSAVGILSVRITAQGQRSRDAIEEDTDKRYFAIWDLDDAATARLGDDLRAIIDALPKG